MSEGIVKYFVRCLLLLEVLNFVLKLVVLLIEFVVGFRKMT